MMTMLLLMTNERVNCDPLNPAAIYFHSYFKFTGLLTEVINHTFNNSLIPVRRKALLIRDNPLFVLPYLEITKIKCNNYYVFSLLKRIQQCIRRGIS